MTPADLDQIIEGIELFIIGPVEDPERRAVWQPYIDKLNGLRDLLAAPAWCPHCGVRLVESDAPCLPEEFAAQQRARERDGALHDAAYEAGRQSLLAAPAAPGWQQMETAPQNRTLVLVALIRDGVIWRASEAAFNGLGWYTKSGEACHWRTHWAPMPTSPARRVARLESLPSPPGAASQEP